MEEEKDTPQFDKKAAEELLKNDSTFAFVLIAILLDQYGEDVFGWETELIYANVNDDFGVELPEENETKINAAIATLTMDLPLISIPVFVATTFSFNEGDIGDEDEEPNVCQILWALYEMALLRGESIDEIQAQLSNSVVRYLNDIIDGEAEDREMEAIEDAGDKRDKNAPVDAAYAEPYFSRYVTLSMLELIRQLAKLDVSKDILLQIINTYRQESLEAKAALTNDKELLFTKN